MNTPKQLYRIEYLRDSADPGAVCHVRHVRAATLGEADRIAGERALCARTFFGAEGYQIRDMGADGRIALVVCDAFAETSPATSPAAA